jgi:hypothetical protein
MTDNKTGNPKDELGDPGELCEGGEEHYDQKAVETIPFDANQFELPDDFELEEDEDDD